MGICHRLGLLVELGKFGYGRFNGDWYLSSLLVPLYSAVGHAVDCGVTTSWVEFGECAVVW